MTSLSDQLKRLAVPQSIVLAGALKRPSLLFSPKHAASLDHEHFFEIGVSGLEALKQMNRQFNTVGASLFDSSALSMERAVQSAEVNRRLDAEVRSLLLLLQPYLLLQPALKLLEWLVHRFQIERYCVDDLLMLALAYHETPTFIKIVQLVDLTDPASRWHWLLPIQGPGLPLGRRDLLRRCSRDPGLLKLVCANTLAAAKQHGADSAAGLGTLFAFHTAVLVGTFHLQTAVTELQMAHITKSLLRGLKSEAADFAAGALMATAQIAQKAQLGAAFIATLVRVIIDKSAVADLEEERALALVLVYRTQKEAPASAALPLLGRPALTSALAALAERRVDVLPLLLALVDAALAEGDQELDRVVALVAALALAPGQARVLADRILDGCTEALASSAGYRSALGALERQHGAALDAALAGRDSESLRTALARQDGSVFLQLHHASAERRALALTTLAQLLPTLGKKDLSALSSALAERLRDDSAEVVLAALAFPASTLAELLGPTPALDSLLSVLARCHGAGGRWDDVAAAAVAALAELPAECPPARTLAHLLPHLLPTGPGQTAVSLRVLGSALASRDPFLRRVAAAAGAASAADAARVCAAVLATLRSPGKLLPSHTQFQELLDGECNTAALGLSATLLMTAALPKKLAPAQADALASSVLTASDRLTERSREHADTDAADTGAALDLAECAAIAGQGRFPLPALIHALAAILQRAPALETTAPFWLLAQPQAAAPYLRCLSALVTGSCGQRSEPARARYAAALADFLRLRFPQRRHRVELLAQAAMVPSPLVSPHLQVRFLRLSAVLLSPGAGDEPTARWLPVLLLCATGSAVSAVRRAALACVAALALQGAGTEHSALLLGLVERREEIALDAKQVAPALQRLLSPDKKLRSRLPPMDAPALAASCDSLFALASAANTPLHVVAALLSALAAVESPALALTLAPLGHRLLDAGAFASAAETAALAALLARFTPRVAPLLHDADGTLWMLLARCLRHPAQTTAGASVAETTMAALTKETLAALTPDTIGRLLAVLVSVVSESDQPGIPAAAGRLVKRTPLPAALPATYLIEMAAATAPLPAASSRKSRFLETAPSPAVLSTAEWRAGVAMLELAQNKKLLAPAALLPPLYAVLARCLQFELQPLVEYPKQLVLSLLLQCCQRASAAADEAAETAEQCCQRAGLGVESVVQCVRASQNPQTHHHALLVLAQLAAMAPQQVLHNVMSIFTFMGSSVLRQDDAYSVQVITKIVDTIVPIIVSCSGSESKGPAAAPGAASGRGVLRVFVDALPGIPAHRVQPLFQRLLTALGARQALWPLLALLLEAQVMHGGKQSATGLSLAETQPAADLVHAATRLLDYLMLLPRDKQAHESAASKPKQPSSVDASELFDPAAHTEKQLRHLKFLLAQQVGALLSVPGLAQRLQAEPADAGALEALYSELLERLLTLVQRWLAQVSASAGLPTGKYWRVMLTLALDTLDKVNALLPTEMFIIVIKGLLSHRQPVLQRKAMELLNARLQHQAEFDTEQVLNLMPRIMDIVATILQPEGGAGSGTGGGAGGSAETELCQQTALLSVKLLAHRLAATHPEPFVSALPLVTRLTCANLPHGNLQAAVVLCLAELCVVLKVRAVAHISQFLPALIKLLDEQAKLDSPDLATLSVVAALDKVAEALAAFVGPHLPALLRASALAQARWSALAGQPRAAPTLARLAAARQRLAAAVPARVFVPAATQCYQRLETAGEFPAVAPLLDALSCSFSRLGSAELRQLLPALSAFFLAALEVRASGPAPARALDVEGHVIAALVRLVLKLSEETFRPLYLSLFHWASGPGAPSARAVTFYRLAASMARSLKGLYALFAVESVWHAAGLLSAAAADGADDVDAGELAEHVLDSLLQAVSHGGARFATAERFNALMQPIVNQLELATSAGGSDRAERLVAPCLANLAVASGDDVLWKQLNYQVLLKTRDARPQVRLAALKALCQVAGKLADDYLPLLPESIPFLAELLEDEDEDVERAAQAAMRELQTALGEPLDKYL